MLSLWGGFIQGRTGNKVVSGPISQISRDTRITLVFNNRGTKAQKNDRGEDF